MGDVLHTLPAVTDAQKKIKNIKFDWVVEEGFAEIPSWHSALDRVIPIAFRRWRKNWFKAIKAGEIKKFWQQLRQEKYDLIIDAQGLLKSAIIAKLAHGISCGLDKKSAREGLASLFYKRKYFVKKDLHAIDRVRLLFSQALNYEIDNRLDYGISVKPLKNTKAQYLVFVHGTSRDDKCWPEQRWIELVQLAGQAGFLVKLPWGSKKEHARAKRIATACKNTEVLNKLTLTEIAEVITGATAVVAVDTGIGHLTAALGVPCVSLYGPTDVRLIGAKGNKQLHISRDKMQDITADLVWDTLSEQAGI